MRNRIFLHILFGWFILNLGSKLLRFWGGVIIFFHNFFFVVFVEVGLFILSEETIWECKDRNLCPYFIFFML